MFPVGAVTKGLKGEELAEIGGMVDEGARAISDDGMPVMNSYLMRKAMDYSKAFGVPIISHAEDANLVGQGVMNEGALSNSARASRKSRGGRGNHGRARDRALPPDPRADSHRASFRPTSASSTSAARKKPDFPSPPKRRPTI